MCFMAISDIYLEFTLGDIQVKLKNGHVFYPTGKLIAPHLLCCQGIAVRQRAVADSFNLGALKLRHSQLLQR